MYLFRDTARRQSASRESVLTTSVTLTQTKVKLKSLSVQKQKLYFMTLPRFTTVRYFPNYFTNSKLTKRKREVLSVLRMFLATSNSLIFLTSLTFQKTVI